jgi:hypothetical protein
MPAMLRRRCSVFAKVSLSVAHAALRGLSGDGAVPTVFASTHGESHVTAGLLNELAQSQQLSPMSFSLSVHNAASGLFSIATGNTAPASALSSEFDCLLMGLCEAITMLSQGDAKQVLLVCSDDIVAEEFRRGDERCSPPFAIALLIGTGAEESNSCQLSFEQIAGISERVDEQVPQGVLVARWLAGDGVELDIEAVNARWILSRSGRNPSTLFASSKSS